MTRLYVNTFQRYEQSQASRNIIIINYYTGGRRIFILVPTETDPSTKTVVVPLPVAPLASDAAIRRRAEADRLLAQARQRQQAGEPQDSRTLIEQGLQLVPDHADLLALREEVDRQLNAARKRVQEEQRLQAELQAEQFLEQAQRARQEGALDRSLVHIEQGLQSLPYHAGLLALKREVLAQQAELKRREESARRQAEAAEQRSLEAERQRAEAERRLVEAERRRAQADELLARALDAQRNRAYETSLLRIEQGLQQVPDHGRLLALRDRVRKQLREATAPAPAPPAEPVDRVAALLQECAVHLQANRLTSGKGGNAADCYGRVLQREPGNAGARAGLEQIADHYADLAAAALRRSDVKTAKSSLDKLERLNRGDPRLADLREQLARGQKPVSPPPPAAVVEPEPTPPPSDRVARAEPPVEPVALPPKPRPEPEAKPEPKPEPEPEPEPEPPKSRPAETQTVATATPSAQPNCLRGNCQNGEGTYRHPDGSEYTGDFRNAKMHGQGAYVYAGRGEKYVGEWRNGAIDGQGAYYYRSGNRYQGEWRNGRKHGQGTYLYANGDKYVGDFADDQPNGQGVYYYRNGDRYEGAWRNGRKHGQGVIYESGQRIVGEWQDDRRVRVAVQSEPATPRVVPAPTDELPKFPWPPPKSSARVNIPSKFLEGLNTKQLSLEDVNSILTSSLNKVGYTELSYYAVPDGFALVTRLEQIYPDGTPKENSERWRVQVGRIESFSLEGYLKALFTANPGYFRIIVFIVTPSPFYQIDTEVDREEATGWLPKGMDRLPPKIGAMEYSKEYKCTALIYEFEHPRHSKTKPIVKIPGRLTAQAHLTKAKIFSSDW